MTTLAKILSDRRVSVVLDVGANAGQFAKGLRLGGYKGRIVSFEPLSNAHARLARTAKNDPDWIVAPRVAIGDRDCVIQINVAGNSVSSSVLGMLPAHISADPESAYVGRETVAMRTLDSAAAEYVTNDDRIFLKADVQGAEDLVLAGATRLLPRVVGLEIELSLLPCYRDQILFLAMIEQVGRLGYALWGLSPGAVDEQTGRQLQVDGLFLRDGDKPVHYCPVHEVSKSYNKRSQLTPSEQL